MTAPVLQDKLVEILTQLQSAVKTGADFAIEQLPDIAQQYVAYGLWSAWGFTAFFTSLTLLGCVGVVWAFLSKADDRYGEPTVTRILVGIVSGVSAPLFGTGAVVNFNEALLVTLAPKVWLLKELASLIK